MNEWKHINIFAVFTPLNNFRGEITEWMNLQVVKGVKAVNFYLLESEYTFP